MSEVSGSVGAVSSSGSGDASSQSGVQAGANEGKVSEGLNDTKKMSQESEYDEVKIGSVSGKVPKQIAEAIKNLERGFQSKAQKAAQMEKLVGLAQSNPKEFWKTTGQDPYEFAENLLAEKYEMMQMSPEQRRLKELEARVKEQDDRETSSKNQILNELKKYGEIPQGAEKASKEELLQYLRHQENQYSNEMKSLDQQIGEAFRDSGLFPDKYVIAKVAFEMSSALKRGKNLTAKEAVARVNQDFFGGVKNLFQNMDVKRIHEVLGDDFLEKLRKYDLEQVTASAASRLGQNQFGQAKQASSQEPKKKYLNEIEWRKAMGLR